MQTTPRALLRRLEASQAAHGPLSAANKIELLRSLDRASFGSPRELLRLHEQLCFLRACPDDSALLAQVEAMLARFARRADLRRHRARLADSGIAGTEIRYRFFWASARWLALRWPGLLRIDWEGFDHVDDLVGTGKLAMALPLIATPLEAAWLRARSPAPRPALRHMCAGSATDACWLVRRIAAMPGNDFTREAFFDALDTPFVLAPGPGTPSRTLARFGASPVAFVAAPPRRERPDLRAELKRAPQSVRAVTAREGASLIDLARGAMVTRARDLDAFAYGNARDVLLVDDGEGLQWALIGMMPGRRALLRAAYGFLTLRSGVPVGYGQLDVLFGCVDLSFNTFESFRGADSARVFARLLAACRAVFRATSFTLEPYQLGLGNEEAIASGAWWFYAKLGFRPREAAVQRLAARELARMRASPQYRSSPATLERLSRAYLCFETAGARAPHWPSLADIGVHCAARLADAGQDSREAAVRELSRRAMRALGLRDLRRASPEQRQAWERWAPVVAMLPIDRWSAQERRALAEVILARGGRSETAYLEKFDAHARLGRALRALTGA